MQSCKTKLLFGLKFTITRKYGKCFIIIQVLYTPSFSGWPLRKLFKLLLKLAIHAKGINYYLPWHVLGEISCVNWNLYYTHLSRKALYDATIGQKNELLTELFRDDEMLNFVFSRWGIFFFFSWTHLIINRRRGASWQIVEIFISRQGRSETKRMKKN